MSKKKIIEVKDSSLLESEYYPIVENFFKDKKGCEITGIAADPISLVIFGGKVYPDVYGVNNPTKNNFNIYMAEGKLNLRGRDFDICKGQAITLQRFADYVYVFFPRLSWDSLGEEEKIDIDKELKDHRLGLLLVKKDQCEEKIAPSTNTNLLKEENRIYVRDEIINYFPNFIGPQENFDFFKRYLGLADIIVKESYILIEYLVESFRKVTSVSKQSIKCWYVNDTFEFYLFSRLKNTEVFLTIKPFGSEDFDIKYPVLLVEERFSSSILKKNGIRQRIVKHIDDCIVRKCNVDTGDLIFYGSDTGKDVIKHLGASKSKNFTIIEPIDIMGIQKEKIREKVEESLKRIIDFSKSL